MGKRGEEMQTAVLAILRASDCPHSAYDLLESLKDIYPKIAPPTVYRALAALVERGQIHRLESLNAYIACQSEAHHQASVLSICEDCGAVEENFEPLCLAPYIRPLIFVFSNKVSGTGGFMFRA